MVELNLDVIYAIAEHIEPNPITFNRLAEVSKDFRTVFTSDWVWRYLNMKALESGIRADFMREVTKSQLPLLKAAWGAVTAETSTGYTTGSTYLWMGCGTRYEPSEPFGHWNDWWSRQTTWCAVHISGHAIRFALNYLADKELALIAVQKHGCVLEWLHHSLRADREVVQAAVARGCPPGCRYHRKRESVLRYAAAKLCDDAELVRIAVTADPCSLKYASARLRDNIAIVNAAAAVDGRALEYALQLERSSLRLAVANYGLALRWAQLDWHYDIEIVSTAVANDGLALQYAAPRLKKKDKVVLKAVRNNGLALSYAHETLRNDHMIALEAVRSNGDALQFVSVRLKANFKVVEQAVMQNALALKYAQGEAATDFAIVKAAVENNGMAIKYASSSTPNYNDLKLIALEHVSLDKKDTRSLFTKLFGDQVSADSKYTRVLAYRNPDIVSLKSKKSSGGQDLDVPWGEDCLSVQGAIALKPDLYTSQKSLPSSQAEGYLRQAISADPTKISLATPEQRDSSRIKNAIYYINAKGWKECFPDIIAKPQKAQSKLPTVGRAPRTDIPVSEEEKAKTADEQKDEKSELEAPHHKGSPRDTSISSSTTPETANEQRDPEKSKQEAESPQSTPDSNAKSPTTHSLNDDDGDDDDGDEGDSCDEGDSSCSSDDELMSSYELVSDSDHTTSEELSDIDSNDEAGAWE